MDVNMEIENESISKRSFSLNKRLFDLLHIVTNVNNDIIFWNKYQIFLYKLSDFNADPVYFEPLFKVLNVVFNDKYIACLDYSKNIHITSLNYKKSVEHKISIPFKPVAKNILSLLQLEDALLTLQNQFGEYSICLNYFTNIFLKNVENYTLTNLEECITENIVFRSYYISNLNIQCLETVFKMNKENVFDGILIIVVLDSRTVYGFILNKKEKSIDNTIAVKKLYYSATDICEINIIEIGYNINIIIALKSGTVIRLPFDNNLVPQVIHLNTEINKFVANKDEFVYSDGLTMWKAIHSFTKEITFQELFVKNPKDFVLIKDLAICVTYSNIIYVFLVENINKVKAENKYDPVNTVVQSIELLFEEIKNNDELVKRIEIERNYTIAIALGNRQDIINELIQCYITVFDSYEEVLHENTDINLTNDFQEYFIPKSFLMLIRLIFKSDYNSDLNNIFTSLTDLIKLHITIRIKSLIIKTLSVSIKDLDKCSFLVPFNGGEETEFDVNLKLICSIGYLYDKEPNWVILFKRNVKITSESFIKIVKSNKTSIITQLREDTEDFSSLLIKTAQKQNEHLNIQKECRTNIEISYFIKLPTDYEDILSNKNMYKNINSIKAEYLVKKLSTNDFLKRNHVVQINVCEFKIRLKIYKDNSFILKLTGDNPLIALHMKKYFSQILFRENEKLIISQAEYTNVENLRRKLINCQCSRDVPADSIMQIADEFNKNILINLI